MKDANWQAVKSIYLEGIASGNATFEMEVPEIEDGIIIDPTSYAAPNKESPSVPRTRNSFQLPLSIYFPGATAIIPQEQSEDSNIELTALAWTSTDSWLEKNHIHGEEGEFDEGTDLEGPLALAALVTSSTTNKATEGEENIGMRVLLHLDH